MFLSEFSVAMVLLHSDFLPILFPGASGLSPTQTLWHTGNGGISPLPMRQLMLQVQLQHTLSENQLVPCC